MESEPNKKTRSDQEKIKELRQSQWSAQRQKTGDEEQVVKPFPTDYERETQRQLRPSELKSKSPKKKHFQIPGEQNKQELDQSVSSSRPKQEKQGPCKWRGCFDPLTNKKIPLIYIVGAILLLLVPLLILQRRMNQRVQKLQLNTQEKNQRIQKLQLYVHKKKIADQKLQKQLQESKLYDLAKKNELQTYMKITNCMLFSLDESITLGVKQPISDKRGAITSKKNIEYLSGLKNLKMKYLYLWNNKFEMSDIESIFKASWFNQLKALEVDQNELTDEFIDKLISEKRPNLVWLNLSNNKITEKGISTLINNAHMLPSLKHINYLSPEIKDIYKLHLKIKEMLPNVNFERE